MKNFLTSLIFSFGCLLMHAQQTRFIYLQTENKQPFFVKLNNKVLNSSPLGYLIIPQLQDSLYSLLIGFPNSDNEQEFNCAINKKDIGFMIKATGEKQWQLMNLQTYNVIIPGDVITKTVINYEKSTDPFSIMLANAVHDSTILRKDIVKEIVPEKSVDQNQKDSSIHIVSANDIVILKPDTVLIIDSVKKNITIETTTDKPIQKDSSIVIPSANEVTIVKADSTATNNSINKKDIVTITQTEKPAELIQKDTTQIIAASDVAINKSRKKKKSRKNYNALQDSVTVQKEIVKEIIPEKIDEKKDTTQNGIINADVALVKSDIKRKLKKNSKEGMEMIYVDDDGNTKDTIRILIPSDKKQKQDEEITEPVVSVPVISQSDKPNNTEKNKVEGKISTDEIEIIKEANNDIVKSTMINSDCKNFATDDDFLKIRKRMVAQYNDEDMIKVAKKVFKNKCFATEQIKNLSALFLKDDGKYRFFDAAYPFVSDSDIYYTLEKQLSDNYYITRFRAMIHK